MFWVHGILFVTDEFEVRTEQIPITIGGTVTNQDLTGTLSKPLDILRPS